MLQKSKGDNSASTTTTGGYKFSFEEYNGKNYPFTLQTPNGNIYSSRKSLSREDLPFLRSFLWSNGGDAKVLEQFERDAKKAIENQMPKAPCKQRSKNGHPYYY